MQTKSNTGKKLRWDMIFFFNALAAAIFSFSEIAPVAAGVAKGFCYIFLIFFVLSLCNLFLEKALE